jgi:hypothetical protein
LSNKKFFPDKLFKNQKSNEPLTAEKSFEAEYVPKHGNLLELGYGAGNISLWFAKQGL